MRNILTKKEKTSKIRIWTSTKIVVYLYRNRGEMVKMGLFRLFFRPKVEEKR